MNQTSLHLKWPTVNVFKELQIKICLDVHIGVHHS